jgi:hypothetical protein
MQFTPKTEEQFITLTLSLSASMHNGDEFDSDLFSEMLRNVSDAELLIIATVSMQEPLLYHTFKREFAQICTCLSKKPTHAIMFLAGTLLESHIPRSNIKIGRDFFLIWSIKNLVSMGMQASRGEDTDNDCAIGFVVAYLEKHNNINISYLTIKKIWDNRNKTIEKLDLTPYFPLV